MAMLKRLKNFWLYAGAFTSSPAVSAGRRVSLCRAEA
jgi:hypothetical protein